MPLDEGSNLGCYETPDADGQSDLNRQYLASEVTMIRSIRLGCSTLLIVAAGCNINTVAVRPAGTEIPLFKRLGSHNRTVTTSSPMAQRYFDQGLIWAYAFNHDEAIRAFRQAAVLDPECPMAWWGISLCNGPHINNAKMPPERSEAAWSALQKALALQHRGSSLEQQLIDALAKRYAFPAPDDRKSLDQAYADAMGALWREHPHDADIATLYAEAMMDLRPWDLWTHDGEAQPGTDRIITILEEVLSRNLSHPGANHLYIHAVEPSPNFRRALAAADRLRDLIPASGHLVHMPSHIDVLVGNWEQAMKQNELAIQADIDYLPHSPQQGFYTRYMAHNHHMLAFACMMVGHSERALQAARELVAGVPEELARTSPQIIDSKMPMVYEVQMRFGRWDDILSEPAPPKYLPLSTAIWRFSRGVAFAAKGKLDEAEHEREEFQRIARTVPEDEKFENALASEVFSVADNVLLGEIAFHRGDYDEAIDKLKTAVRLEDRLPYDEPPVWVQPVRHALGAVLVRAGRYVEAEQVYRKDLEKWPDNGWSLYGLASCLRKRGEMEKANEVQARFRRTWASADTGIGASCLCVLKQ